MALSALALTFGACDQEEIYPERDGLDSGQTLNLETAGDFGSTTFSPTIVGDTVTNPCAMRIVRQAYGNLLGKVGFQSDKLTLSVTDLHVRFMPRDSADEQALSLDSNLVLFDVALDRLVVEYGDGYHDPSVDEGTPTYLYSAVDVNTNLREIGVPFTVLDSLYQPDADTNGEIVRSVEALKLLEEEATAIAKAKSPDYPVEERRRPDYRPTARIRYLEDNNTLQGLEGARITMRRWSKYGEGFTDATGFARSDKEFNYDVNFQLIWERYEFAIKDSWLTRAKIDGPHQATQWNLDINIRGDRDWRRAQVHRGAYRYAYQDILGLSRPPRNGVLRFQLHYRVLDEANSEALGRHCPSCQWLGFGSQIKIWVNNNDGRAQAYVATTIHEAAHAAHWNGYSGNLSWGNAHSRVKENWARGAEFALTRLHYPGYRPLYFKTYTGIVEDMMDAPDGQAMAYLIPHPSIPDRNITAPIRTDVDFVANYSIVQIENAAFRSSTYDEWRDNVRSGSTNPTGNRLAELFTFWDSIPEPN